MNRAAFHVEMLGLEGLHIMPDSRTRALSNFHAGFSQTNPEDLCRFHSSLLGTSVMQMQLLKMQALNSHRDGNPGLRRRVAASP
jgi:hypothetical protein